MQTFLPYSSFSLSLDCLDNKRLGKQRVEAAQLLRSLGVNVPTVSGEPAVSNGWQHHPARLMWIGCEHLLAQYYHECIYTWIRRGFVNNMPFIDLPGTFWVPPWLGDFRFHDSHRSNLLRKNPTHYGQFRWDVPNNLPYFWPTKNGY